MTDRRVLPLPARLALIYAMLVGATLLIVAGLVVHLTRSHLARSLDSRLTAAVESFQEGPAAGVEDVDALARRARRWLSVHAFTADELAAVHTSRGDVLVAAGGLDLAAIDGGADLLTASESRWVDLGGEAGAVRALTVPLVLGDEQLGTLVVAASRSGIDATLSALLSGVAWASAIGLLLASVVGFVTVRRTLRPLSWVAAEVDAVESTGDLSRRVSGAGPRDEVGRLAEAFDRMLERLEGSFAAQQRFLSDASHELRTPLTVIRGQLELLDREIATARGRQSLDAANEELERMRRIVDDLLLLARLDEGLPLRRERVEVELVVGEAILRRVPSGGSLPSSVEVEPDLFVLADPDRLLQVLTNLVGNAAEHAGPEATLSVRARRAGGRVHIEVSDTGRGIPPDELPHVFDRLYRGSQARGRPGSGLGLAIVASLVRSMDGEIDVRSASAEGTTFTVSLPAADAPDRLPAPAKLD